MSLKIRGRRKKMNPKTYKKIIGVEIDVSRKDLNNLFLEVENDDKRKQKGTVTRIEGVLNILNRIVNM